MDINNLINDNGMYLYKDDSFNTINIELKFLIDNEEKNNHIYRVFKYYLATCNKKYRTEEEINKKSNELYSLEMGFYTSIIGSKRMFICDFDLISPSIINDNYLEEAFDFIKDIIFKPDFTNEKELENIKRICISSLENSFSDNEEIAHRLYKTKVCNEDELDIIYATDLEYITELINSITLEDLKRVYEQTINENNFYNGLVFGNIKDEEYKLFRTKFPLTSNKVIDYKKDVKINEETIEIPNKDMNESIVYVTYTLELEDELTGRFINTVLNGNYNLCSKILREKYGLVYYANAQIDYVTKTLCFETMINKKNKEKLIKAIEEIVSLLLEKSKVKEMLSFSKEELKMEDYLISEDKGGLIGHIDEYYISNYYGQECNFNNIDSYTEERFINCTKTLKRKNIFMYRGDCDE